MILIGKGGKPVLNKLNQVTAYIEENLTEELSVEIIASNCRNPLLPAPAFFICRNDPEPNISKRDD